MHLFTLSMRESHFLPHFTKLKAEEKFNKHFLIFLSGV